MKAELAHIQGNKIMLTELINRKLFISNKIQHEEDSC